MKICAVNGCSSRRRNKTKIQDVSSISFFQPTSKTRLEAWSQSLGIKLKPTDFVCQLHFKKDDIKFSYKDVKASDSESNRFKKKILKKFALPTVHFQEQCYPVKTDEIVNEEEELEKKRRKLGKTMPLINQPIAYLKKKFSGLPANWSYVEKPNEIEFIQLDPVTKKIKNIMILQEDLTIMVIGANNKKVYLDEQISSPNEIYEYLKYIEEWTPCVGTHIQKQKYSKQCKGIVFMDESSRSNKIYPRCYPCKILRFGLRNGNTNISNPTEKKTMNKKLKAEKLRPHLGMEKLGINEECNTGNLNNFCRPQTMPGNIDVDLDNIASIKEKIKTLWSSKQFCGLCYFIGDCCPINTELVINKQKYSKCLRDIINYVFNDDAENLMASLFICDNCIEKSIQTYIFIHNSRQMSQIMKNAVDDMNTKITNVRDQLSSSIDNNDANMMIVLENDTETYKSMINTKIYEIIPTSKPLPMTAATYNDSNNTKIELTVTNENNNNESIKEQDFNTQMTDIEMSDTSNDYSKNEVKITKFIPITIPTIMKKTSKIYLKQRKRLSSSGSLTKMKDYTNERSNVNAVYNVSMLKDVCNLNKNTTMSIRHPITLSSGRSLQLMKG